MNTDLELYRVFCEVVKYKNISKTAESMYISQSAITQSIQKLENLLGGKVFYRNKNGVELTEEGKSLYEYIKYSIERINNAENLFSKYNDLEKGKIRIGGSNFLLTSLIFEPFIKFIKQYPQIDVSMNNGSTEILMNKLVNGELDIVALNIPFKTKTYSNIQIIPLRKTKFCFFASKDYIKENKIQSIRDLSNHPLILPKALSARKKILDDFCQKEDIKLVSNYEISSSNIMKMLVLNNIGIGFTNVENLNDIKDQVEIIKLIEIEEATEGIATLNKNMQNKATIELVEAIKEYYKQN